MRHFTSVISYSVVLIWNSLKQLTEFFRSWLGTVGTWEIRQDSDDQVLPGSDNPCSTGFVIGIDPDWNESDRIRSLAFDLGRDTRNNLKFKKTH